MAKQADRKATGAGRRFRWLGWATATGAAVLALVMLHFVSNSADSSDKPPRDQFAADRDGGGAGSGGEAPVAIDGKRALGYLEAICKIGPRVSGSDGMARQQELIDKHFKGLGAAVSYQKFTATQRSARKPVAMANLVVSYHPERARRVILCSHYDTRPIADQEANRHRWKEPFVSANDGGSGVALLMELGHHMKGIETHVGVDFVFFDGEEYIFEPKKDLYFFGSKHFADEYRQNRRKVEYRGAILLDMIAGKGATFPIEQNSWIKASALTRDIWRIAAELKCGAFQERLSRFAVEDDHLPLNRAGIPAIDIIDFDYPHWHLLTDLPRNCSAAPLDQVARVCSVWLQRVR